MSCDAWNHMGKRLPHTIVLKLWVRIPPRRGVLDTTLCDKVNQWVGTGQWFTPGIPDSSPNKTNHHDITEILLKVALITLRQTKPNHTIVNLLVIIFGLVPIRWCYRAPDKLRICVFYAMKTSKNACIYFLNIQW